MFLVTFLAILTAVAITLALRVPFTSETLRKRVVQTLSDQLDAEVELGGLTLRVLPALRADGTGLRVRHRGRRNIPPLISIDTFTANADLLGLWRHHVAHVKLTGLDIQVPPHDHLPICGGQLMQCPVHRGRDIGRFVTGYDFASRRGGALVAPARLLGSEGIG